MDDDEVVEDEDQELEEDKSSDEDEESETSTEEVTENNDDESRTISFRSLVIEVGMSQNRRNYSQEVLIESISLLEGRPIFVDHWESGFNPSNPASRVRSIKSNVGWWSDIEFGEVEGASGLIGTANLYKSSPEPWLIKRVEDAIAVGRPQDIAFSVFGESKVRMRRDSNGPYKDMIKIIKYRSADFVSEPGAGGRVLNFVESEGEDTEVEKIKEAKTLEELMAAAPEMTIAEAKEVRPDLFEVKESKEDEDEDKDKKEETTETKEDETSDDSSIEEISEALAGMKAQYAELTKLQRLQFLENKMTEQAVPNSLRDKIRARFTESKVLLSEEQITSIIEEYAEVYKLGRPANANMGGFSVPFGAISQGASMADRIQASSDRLFGLTAEDMSEGITEQDIWDVGSIREFYTALTGDVAVTGNADLSRSMFAEVNFPGNNDVPFVSGTGTNFPSLANHVNLANIFGLSMNRMLIKLYKGQNLWWTPLVDYANLTNMKVQTRVARHEFAAMPERTAEFADYAVIQYGERAETYQPKEYGHVFRLSRLAIINDDLGAFRDVPRQFAISAALTINGFVAGLFTSNSGVGPNLADGHAVFNATNHKNVTAAAASSASLQDVIVSMAKQQNHEGQVIGFTPKYWVIPPDMIPTAFELQNTVMVPESANNALNINASSKYGMQPAISVPNFTDVDTSYIMADPAEVVSIELGFLGGRQMPDLIPQFDPSTGLVFTNDAMSWKQRWDFGGGWLDYRGAHKLN